MRTCPARRAGRSVRFPLRLACALIGLMLASLAGLSFAAEPAAGPAPAVGSPAVAPASPPNADLGSAPGPLADSSPAPVVPTPATPAPVEPAPAAAPTAEPVAAEPAPAPVASPEPAPATAAPPVETAPAAASPAPESPEPPTPARDGPSRESAPAVDASPAASRGADAGPETPSAPAASPPPDPAAAVATASATASDSEELPMYGESTSTRFRRSRGGTFLTVYLEHCRAEDVLPPIQSMLGGDGGELTIAVSSSTNALLLRTKDPHSPLLAEAVDLIKSLDFRTGQVLIDVLIVEFNLDDQDMFNTEFKNLVRNPLGAADTMATFEGDTGLSGSSGNSGTGGAVNPLTTTGGFKAFVTSQNRLKAFLAAVKTKNRTKVISCPHIVAANHRQAQFSIGESVTVLTSTQPSDNGDVKNFGNLPVNLTLTVTPHVNRSRRIDLDIRQEVRQVKSYDPANRVANTFERLVDTDLSVTDGETAVLGGFIAEQKDEAERRLPVLGNLPAVGKVFRYKQNRVKRTELVVFITPRIIETIEDGRQVVAMAKKAVTWREKLDEVLERRLSLLQSTKSASEALLIARGAAGWRFDSLPEGLAPAIKSCPDSLDLGGFVPTREGVCPFGFGPSRQLSPESVRTRLAPDDGYLLIRRFTVVDPAAFSRLVLRVASDNAAAVYLNGRLVDRDPAMATRDGHDHDYWNRLLEDVPTSLLVRGENELVVLLANDEAVTDAYLDLELGAIAR